MDASILRRLRLSTRTWVILALLAAGSVAGYAAYLAYRFGAVVVPDAYAQEWATFLVIEHIEQNDGEWPNSWDSLVKPYEALRKKHGSFMPLAEIRERVEIDFDADPDTLREMPLEPKLPPFKVIYLRSGAKHHSKGWEPNQMIWNYLNGLPPVANQTKIPN